MLKPICHVCINSGHVLLYKVSPWLVLLLVLSSTTSHTAQARQQSPTLVVTEQVSFEPKIDRLETVGSARALQSVTLYPAIADRVIEVNIIPGQYVTEGTVLLRLDNRRQRVAVERANIQLRDAERTVERLRASRERDAIPQSELDDAITARDLLAVTLTEAETELEDRLIRAPFSGVVGITDVQAGDRINTQTPVTTIDDRSQLYIDFQAPESALSMLNDEPVLIVSPWHQSNRKVNAQIVEIDSRLEANNRSIRIRALIDNEQQQFRAGTSFRIELQQMGNDYASIPEAALMWGPTSAYIWRVVDEKAKRIDVQIRQRLRGRILVDGELQQGDTIITEGVQSVREGQAVTTQPEGDAE